MHASRFSVVVYLHTIPYNQLGVSDAAQFAEGPAKDQKSDDEEAVCASNRAQGLAKRKIGLYPYKAFRTYISPFGQVVRHCTCT